jgi:hypothetical protein
MAEIDIAYLEDGEWLSVSTNPRSGRLLGIEPAVTDEIAVTESEPFVEVRPGVFDASRGWARMVSPAGQFKINAPYDDRLSDWGLELTGIPRMYDRLKLDVITQLFSEEVTEQIEQYHRKYNRRRESVGDLIAKFMRRGPQSMEEDFDIMKSKTLVTSRDINAETRDARASVLEQAIEGSGRVIIARSVLIAE